MSYGFRQLRRAPVFAVTVAVTLALGLGANTLAFSIVHAVLVRELPYPDPDRIIFVWFSPPERPETRDGATLQNYFAVRDRSHAFEVVGSMSGLVASIATGPDDVAGGEPVRGQRIQATLPRVLGVAPALGRWFTEVDDPATAARKLVLSHRLWQQRFGGDPAVIGRLVRVDGDEATVIGVMPDGFEILEADAQFWTPSRRVHLGYARTAADFAGCRRRRSCHRLRQRGGLLLAQASARRQEFAMRIALGSSRGRLARQLFAESVPLSTLE